MSDRYERTSRDKSTHDDRRHRRSRSRSRSRSPDRRNDVELPAGARPIHEEDDYFRKATELKLWLWEEKSKVSLRCASAGELGD